jgi:hypothetical protein
LRDSELWGTYLSALAGSTNDWHDRVDALNDMATKSFIHQTGVEADLRKQLTDMKANGLAMEDTLKAEILRLSQASL